MGLFRGTAWYYARFRTRYPEELLNLLAERAGLDGTGRLLDLGTGTGQIAVPLASHVEEVVAVDPEQEMLDELDAPPNLRTVCARAEDVDASWGAFRLVTIGNAFHWMEPAILERLPTDQVALLAIELDDFQREALTLAEEMLGPRPAMAHPDVRYEEALAASPFSTLERLAVEFERESSVDEQIGFAFSTSYASIERLGGRRDEYERELRARVQARTERLTAVAYLGRRSDQ